MSATHNLFGASTQNRRCTRSGNLRSAFYRCSSDGFAATNRPARTSLVHQTRHPVTADPPSGPTHRGMHHAYHADRIVRCVDSGDLPDQHFIAHTPGRVGASFRNPIATCSDEPTIRASKRDADWLDPETIFEYVYKPEHLVLGRLGPAAKNDEADFKISFARHISAFLRFRRLISGGSSLLMPGRSPESTFSWRYQRRTASGLTLRRDATFLIVSNPVAWSGKASSAIRTARCRDSGGY